MRVIGHVAMAVQHERLTFERLGHASVRIETDDVFIPPIGGNFTMDRQEAARFTGSIGPELVLPVHYDTFEEIETDADAFKQEVENDERSVQLF